MGNEGDGKVIPKTETPAQINNVLIGIDSIPNFEGHSSIEEFLSIIEETAVLANWSEEQRLSVARLKLRGQAKQLLEAEPTLKNTKQWKDLKEALQNQFTKHFVSGSAMKQFIECKQRMGESCRQFLTRLKILGNRTLKLTRIPGTDQIIKTKLEQDITSQFVLGLCLPIKQRVLSANPTGLEDALEIAEREETIESFLKPTNNRECRMVQTSEQKPNGYNSQNYSYQPKPTFNRRNQNQSGVANSMGQNGNCFVCNRPGHWKNECKERRRPQTEVKCYQCQEMGHIARFCPGKRTQSLNANTATFHPRSSAVREARWQ